MIPEKWSASKYDEIAKEIVNEPVCDPMLEVAINACDVQNKLKSHNFTSSTEYMDSIRRSSESVYARTEALANKTTSFKVMRPRL